jgi:SH3-like domain-containing protein
VAPKIDAPAKAVPAKAVVAEKKTPAQSGALTLLQGKLTASELRVRELEQQLSDAKSQLSAAEVEINRLSGIISGGSRARLATRSVDTPPRASAPAVAAEASRVNQRAASTGLDERPQIASDVAPPPVTQNLQVATVAVDKAELRLGPGKNHSALMAIPRGSRLAVEVRQGEWYRVFAPTGERAWIQSSLVRFGDGAASMNDGSSVKVRGYDVSVEQQAFRRASALTGGK